MLQRLVDISRTRYTWHNATNNVICEPLRFFYPRDEKDIIDIIKEAEENHLRVRAVGSGHSFSEVAKINDFLMDMKYLRDAAKYESPWLKQGALTRHFVIADAGITIRRLNRLLDKMGLALENMGAVDFQTVSGALMTGTHGTGIKRPAFPDMVRALRIVGTGGKLTQIEPSDGITDPVFHQANSQIELIQNDDIFYATVLSFGGMGIVYQLVFEVRTSYYISERRYLIPWSKLQVEMQNGSFMKMVQDNDFVALRINPYVMKGDNLASVVV
ncbi:MAG: FAD-binding protein, partial [Saprospiraceae bacterium]